MKYISNIVTHKRNQINLDFFTGVDKIFRGGELSDIPFFHSIGAKGLKVSIWPIMEGSIKNFGFHQP